MPKTVCYKILTASQCDSVKILRTVTKAVYVMQSDMDPHYFRFGAIGIRGVNTGVRRLGQCVGVKDGAVDHSWHFLVIAHFIDTTPRDVIGRIEKILRREFISGESARFRQKVRTRMDIFHESRVNEVSKAFREIISETKDLRPQ